MGLGNGEHDLKPICRGDSDIDTGASLLPCIAGRAITVMGWA